MLLRIVKTIATSGFLAALACTKCVFGRGSAQDPTGGAYRAHPDPISGFRGPTSKGRGKGEERKGREEVERKGTGKTGPPFANS